MKKCSRCKEEKLISDFYKDKQKSDGYSPHCKSCELKGQQIYKTTHPKRYWARRTLADHRADGFKVTLTLDELFDYIKPLDKCELCGCTLDWSRYTKDRHPISTSPSLDRKENETSISKNNFMVICHKCNITKQNRTLKEFISYCKHIASLHGDD